MVSFYDTVVFVLSLNSTDPDYRFCAELVDARYIRWCVALSDVTLGESTVGVYVEKLLVEWAFQGIAFSQVTAAEIKAARKRHRGTLRKLEQMRLQSRDASQVAAAAHAAAQYLVTRDADFFDPSRKRTSGSAGGRPGKVAQVIRKELRIEVVLPREARARMDGH
jgi:hypothetical protein